MSGPRTVAVPTDGGGQLVMPEPTWCAGHPAAVVEALSDFHHKGPDVALTVDTPRGPVPAMLACLVEYPLSIMPGGTVPHVSMLAGTEGVQMDGQALAVFADSLCDYAERLHTLAGELATILEQGEDR